MTISIALPQLHNPWLDRLRTVHLGIGVRGAVGVGLARQRGGAKSWWLPTGITAGNCLGAWSSIGVASYSGSLIDVNGTGKNLVEYGGIETPGWDSDGWIFNATQQRLRTNVDNSVAKSGFVRIRPYAYGGSPMGGNGGSGSYRWYFWVHSAPIMSYGYGGFVNPSGLTLNIYYTLALSQRQAFMNGVYVGQTGSGTVSGCNIEIGHRAVNNNETVFLPFNGRITHAALYSVALSDSQQAELHSNASA